MGALDLIIARGFGDQVRDIATSGSRAVEWQNQRKAEEQAASINDFNLQASQQNQAAALQDRARIDQYRTETNPLFQQRSQINDAVLKLQAAGQPIPPELLTEALSLDERIRASAMQTASPTTVLEMYNRKPPAPESTVGKLRADLAAGRITPQEFEVAFNKATNIPQPSSVSVSLPPQQNSFEQETGKVNAKALGDLNKQGLQADQMVARYNRLEALLSGVETGKLTPAGTELAAYAQGIGLEIDPKLPNKQAATALINQMILSIRNPDSGMGLPGSTSDRDLLFLEATLPRLANTPGANKIVIETGRRLAQRQKDVARLAREYQARKGTFDNGFYQELEAWAEATPLFDDLAAQAPPDPLGIR